MRLILMTLTDMIFNSTVIGASHLQSGKECQDASLTWRNRSGSIQAAAVSDGHGGEAYINSAIGAKLACKVAVSTLREVANSVKRLPRDTARTGNMVASVCRSILARWHEAVDVVRGDDEVKTFGCTLIAYLQTPEYWIALQIGDGKFAILDSNDGWSQPIPWDDRCIINFTTSMCDENASGEFRSAVGFSTPKGIFLSSDGIDSTFEDGELLYNFYAHVMESALTEGYRKTVAEMPKFLSHFSEVGSRDDMSLAVIINRKSRK